MIFPSFIILILHNKWLIRCKKKVFKSRGSVSPRTSRVEERKDAIVYCRSHDNHVHFITVLRIKKFWYTRFIIGSEMGILPLKKRVNCDKCKFATKQHMFGVFAIDEPRLLTRALCATLVLCRNINNQETEIKRPHRPHRYTTTYYRC